MLQGTQHYVNHISDKGLMHITAPHMCAYTYTRTHGGKKYIKKKKKITLLKLDILQYWNYVSLCFLHLVSSDFFSVLATALLMTHLLATSTATFVPSFTEHLQDKNALLEENQ